jgi:type I restriction enzyme S subunit
MVSENKKIPNTWDLKRIGDLGEIVTGSTPKTNVDEYWGGDIPFVSPTDMKGTRYIKDTERTVTYKGAQTGRIIPKNSVMVTCIASIGKLAISSQECITNQQINTIIPHKDYNHEFLYYAISNQVPYLQTLAGTTAVPIINKKTFSDVLLPVPPIKEQHKIAAILSSVDEAIEKTEAIIEQTEKVKKGLMQQLLTKGIGHTKFKKTEIGEIPEEWEVRRLEEICEIRYGKSPKGVKVEYSDYPIMGTSGHVGYAKEFLFSGPMILVGRKGTIDKPIYIERDCWIIDTAYGLFADQTKVSLKWLYYFLTSYDLASLNEATGVPSLNRNSLYSIKVPLPSLNEQNKISNILTSIEQKIETEKEKLSIINEIKKGLMQSLLTGKVRVKVDEDEVVSS